ncbi:long-chain fatty acid--CoA ligase [Alkalihalophilus sp. As8PL]|uniref:Long-chain fatty acid--CoA ligase n=1 Tax=Alkalihalophilus sp. As8PL TaxID=3237103 RepID=A0AB39BWT8_9BACI
MTRPWLKASQEVEDQLEIPLVSLYSILEKSAGTYSDKVAIIYEDHSLTYKELFQKVNKLAESFKSLGMKKGETIGLMLSNHPNYIISFYAAQALGLIVVQVNPRYTPRELVQIVSNSEMKQLIVEADSLDTVTQVQFLHSIDQVIITGNSVRSNEHDGYFSLEELMEEGENKVQHTRINVQEDVAVIQYTGGTTGKMKGAMLTHYNLVANVVQSRVMYGEKMLEGNERILTAIPLYHVYAMTASMNLGIYIGATIILLKQFEINLALDTIKKYQPTFLPGVPRIYTSFVLHPEVEKYRLDCLKFCSSGSAPLPIEIINKFEKLTGAVIGEGFGMSEASPSTHRNPTVGIRKIGSVGIPLPGTDSKIIDDDNNELPSRCVGELVIKGPQIMKGYLNNEKETNHALRNGWLYTGDLAMMDDDGYFYIVGRKKEMIINGGFNVYPQEVENVLYEHQDVREAAVVGIPHEEKGEMIKAFIVLKEGTQADTEEIRGFCYRNLTNYKVPNFFEIVSELPRNTVGKLLKRKLVESELAKHTRKDAL